ncbi:MAG: nucleotide exchange factor GrpE [Gammaproteobacteria bacterium]
MSHSDVTEPPDSSPSQPISDDSPRQTENLLAQLEASENKGREHWERYVRTAAELENLRKRAQREVENAHRFALESFLSELLPVKDSLEIGVAGGEEQSAADICQGMQLTLKLLTQLLAKRGVEEVDPQGELFDPERHEAIGTESAPGIEPNVILKVVQKGYILNGRLLRPARVVVAGSPGS